MLMNRATECRNDNLIFFSLFKYGDFLNFESLEVIPGITITNCPEIVSFSQNNHEQSLDINPCIYSTFKFILFTVNRQFGCRGTDVTIICGVPFVAASILSLHCDCCPVPLEL